MRPLSRRVELEVRRPDHGDSVGARFRGMGGEGDRVGGRLRAAVGGHQGTTPDRLEPELEPAPALVDREEDGLAVRAEREHAVDAGADEEVGIRHECVPVEPRAAVLERCRGGCDRPVQPACQFSGRS